MCANCGPKVRSLKRRAGSKESAAEWAGRPRLVLVGKGLIDSGSVDVDCRDDALNSPYTRKVVIVAHSNDVETLYAYNTRYLVRRSREVRLGQNIATVGNTGNDRGDHVHFEHIAYGDSKKPREHIERVLRSDL